MGHAQQKDLTVGTPWKVLLIFSIPIFLGNLVQMAYSWGDSVFVGQLGATAFSAVGASANLIYPATIFAQGLPAGLGNFTSQLFGAKDIKAVRHSYGISILINLIVGSIMTMVTLLLVPAFLAAGGISSGTALYDYSRIYMYVMLGGLLGTFFLYFYQNFMRAIGDAVLQFVSMGVYAAVNILLDFLFIWVAHWGVMGCALAFVASTVIASIASYFLVYLKYPELHLRKDDFKYDRKFIHNHLRIGIPLALEFSILAIGVMAMQRSIDGYGTAAINGYYAGSRVDYLLCTFIIAYGYSLGAFCGQNYGAKQYKRVKDGISQSMVVLLIQSVIQIVLTFLVRDKAAFFFLANPDAETIKYCRIYLYWDMAGYLLLNMIYLGRNALSAIGKPSVSFWSGVTEMVWRFIGALVLTIPYGVVAALGAQSMAWIFAGIVNFVGFIVFVYAKPIFKKNESLVSETKIPQPGPTIVK
ncbi:MAG: MATE family efflux transporter [Bacilli bacterium]|jgi:putative MATE family efflux protein|nr:MATE family efflux transporter [Bacilli bacterium]